MVNSIGDGDHEQLLYEQKLNHENNESDELEDDIEETDVITTQQANPEISDKEFERNQDCIPLQPINMELVTGQQDKIIPELDVITEQQINSGTSPTTPDSVSERHTTPTSSNQDISQPPASEEQVIGTEYLDEIGLV